jgi:hypothetical protein
VTRVHVALALILLSAGSASAQDRPIANLKALPPAQQVIKVGRRRSSSARHQRRPHSVSTTRMTAMRILALLAMAVVSLAPSMSRADDSLARFRGGVGVNGVSGAGGTIGTAEIVTRNIVRGVQPAPSAWIIADFTADVGPDGHITADGRGLIASGGNTAGTALMLTAGHTATFDVFATLICETAAPFVERNTKPVRLSPGGNFKIDDMLSPRPPAECMTPVLLIRTTQGGSWFAAGIQKFDNE